MGRVDRPALWVPAFAGITVALRRPHKGMKTASGLGMVGPTPPQVLRRGLLRTT